MGQLASLAFAPADGQCPFTSQRSVLLLTSAGLAVSVLLACRPHEDASKSSLMTPHWNSTGSIFALLPRWRLHLSVISRWLPGYLLGGGNLDPTTGKPRSYWSYKADAYEQTCPKYTLSYIARYFGIDGWKQQLAAKLDDAESHSKGREDLRESLSNLMGSNACSSGNEVRIPRDGNQAFDWRRQLIQGAKKRVLFMTAYMSVDDDARAIADDLADAVRRGVEVYVAFDNFGADAFEWCGVDTRYAKAGQEQFEYGDLISGLRAAGAKICFWRAADCARAGTGSSKDYQLYDCKNHIKMIVLDGEVCLLTDRNVGSCYFRNPGYSSVEVVLAGPCADELEAQFANLWNAGGGLPSLAPATKSTSSLRSALFDSLGDKADPTLFKDTWSSVMVSTPRTLETGVDLILLALMLGIRSAKKSVNLMFAYMEICEPLRIELMNALSRGVSVRVVTNSRATNDLFWINSAFLKSVLPIVEAGGKLVMAVCSPEGSGHVHAKIATVDDRFLLVGSWNAWLRSSLYEVEADVFLECPQLASRTSRTIDDLENSKAYQVFDPEKIRQEMREDPLGIDPAVVGFL